MAQSSSRPRSSLGHRPSVSRNGGASLTTRDLRVTRSPLAVLPMPFLGPIGRPRVPLGVPSFARLGTTAGTTSSVMSWLKRAVRPPGVPCLVSHQWADDACNRQHAGTLEQREVVCCVGGHAAVPAASSAGKTTPGAGPARALTPPAANAPAEEHEGPALSRAGGPGCRRR